MMDMESRNQYLFTLISKSGGYHLKSKKEQSAILDEYCRGVTVQNRDYVIRKIRSGTYVKAMRKEKGEKRRMRTSIYDGNVTAHLIKLWDIFDRPSGTRMKQQIASELSRLERFGEILVSTDMEKKLLAISSAEIDRSLSARKAKLQLKAKYTKKVHPLLYQKIPTKIGSKIKRTLDIPKTPYKQVLESKRIPHEQRYQLKRLYDSLNSAELKRSIDKKLDELMRVYTYKNKTAHKVEVHRKTEPISVTFFEM